MGRATNLVLICTTLCIQSAHAAIPGVPPQGTEGQETTWRVYTCPDTSQCAVDIKVKSLAPNNCQIDVVVFIDRNEHQKKQEIVWNIVDLAGYDVQFTGAGIDMKQGAGDMDVPSKGKKQHKQKVKKQDPDRTFLTYDILLEYRATGAPSGTPYTPCDPKGPAIVNRG